MSSFRKKKDNDQPGSLSHPVLCAGSIWHTLLAFGSNFDNEGLYSFRRLSWPASFHSTSFQQLADADFYQCGSKEAFQDMFRTDGKLHL